MGEQRGSAGGIMSKETATLVAAIIAASASIIGVLLAAFQKRREEVRAATRQAVAENLNELGRLIHETIALSTLQSKYTSDANHKLKYASARAAAAKLKSKRLDVRYSLWGIDAGLRELTRLPDWIGHAKNDEDAMANILLAARDLGDVLDAAIRSVYLNGALPSMLAKFKVNRKAKKFRAAYQTFAVKR